MPVPSLTFLKLVLLLIDSILVVLERYALLDNLEIYSATLLLTIRKIQTATLIRKVQKD
jgi:hypothetical protein